MFRTVPFPPPPRQLWIQRVNAGAREHGVTYSKFMHGLVRVSEPIPRPLYAPATTPSRPRTRVAVGRGAQPESALRTRHARAAHLSGAG